MPRTRPEGVDFIERATHTVVVERDVAAAPDEVFEVLADTPSWTKWWPDMRVARWTSKPHGGVGSTRQVSVARLRVHERFVIWEPGHAFGFTFVRINMPITRAGVELVTLEPTAGGGSHVTYTVALELRRPFTGIWGSIQVRFRESITTALDNLASLAAARRPPP